MQASDFAAFFFFGLFGALGDGVGRRWRHSQAGGVEGRWQGWGAAACGGYRSFVSLGQRVSKRLRASLVKARTRPVRPNPCSGNLNKQEH